MKIFYTASYLGKQKYQRYYDMVLRAIRSVKEIELISPEVGNYKKVLAPTIVENIKEPKRLHYEAIRKGIMLADAVIIEVTNEDFQLGHEATLAVQMKKYVLCVSIYEDWSEKIPNRYFLGAKYNEYNIEEIVENFVDYAKKDQFSERFNCFLTPSQLQYLEAMSQKDGVNKSEYLRKLIDDDRAIKSPVLGLIEKG